MAVEGGREERRGSRGREGGRERRGTKKKSEDQSEFGIGISNTISDGNKWGD